jgi:cytochrome P450
MIFALLIAGIFNSGFNAAFLLLELSLNPEWLATVRNEVIAAVDSCVPDKTIPFLDRLAQLKLEDWETRFPMLDLCLKETIRIRTSGCLMRKNTTGHSLKVGSETIPDDTYVMYHLRDVHFNPNVYTNPTKWDPARFLPDRAEHKKTEDAYVGWGGGRHHCGKYS